MYAKFDWFFTDTTGIYDDTRKLMSTNPTAFILALLAIDEERHRHDIAALELNMKALEKKSNKRRVQRYNPDEDMLVLAELRSELVEIRATVTAIRKDQHKRTVRPAPLANSLDTPKKTHHRRRMLSLFRRHI